MQQPSCVSEADLQAYLRGDLANSRAGAVALHLEMCPTCEAEALRLENLRHPPTRTLPRGLLADPNATGPELTRPTDERVPEATQPASPSSIRVPGYEILAELGRGGMSVV